MPLFEKVVPLRGIHGAILGVFSGASFLAAYRDGARSVLTRWSSPDSDGEPLTPFDGAVVGLTASREGRRLALATVHPEDPMFLGSDDPVSLLVLELDPLKGYRLLTPSHGIRFGVDIASPIVRWSEDGRWLALGGLVTPDHSHVCTYLCLFNKDAPESLMVEGRPMQWRKHELFLSRGSEAHASWSPVMRIEKPWDGTLEWVSPDTSYVIRMKDETDAVVVNGDREIAFSSLDIALGEFRWFGPHHIVVAGVHTRHGLDLSRMEDCEILPEDAPPGTPVALSPDGTRAVFTDGESYYWALAG